MKQKDSILFKYITLDRFKECHPNVDVNDLPDVPDIVEKRLCFETNHDTEIKSAIEHGLIYLGAPEIGKRWADLIGLKRIQGYCMCFDSNVICVSSSYCANTEYMNSNYVYFVEVGHKLINRLLASNKEAIDHVIDCVHFDNVTSILKNSTRIALLEPKVQQRMINLINLLQAKLTKSNEPSENDIVI